MDGETEKCREFSDYIYGFNIVRLFMVSCIPDREIV